MNILVIGDSCIDKYIYGECNRLCPEAPVPVFIPIDEKAFGGMAKNVYNNVIAFKKNFTDLSCDIITNTKQSFKTRLVDNKTNQMLLRIDDHDEVLPCNSIYQIDLDKYDTIIVSDYNKGFLTEEHLRYLSEHPSAFIDTKRKIDSWINRYNFIKINKDEYTASKTFVDNHILGRTFITMGIDGCRINNVNYPVSFPKSTVDTSGAGDTFVAALAVEYTRNPDIPRAIRYAQMCCNKVVCKRGTATI